MKFLHIADVHLGCTRYQLPESPRDFFEAWMDVLRRFGVDEKVDFVIMCGDFFHKKAVPPETMDHAVRGLTMMKEAGIPVVAIEGNHDQKHTDNEFSWLRSLSKWGLLTLLEPRSKSEGRNTVTFEYDPWDGEARKGGYIDIGRARIFGSDWYGASGNWARPMLTKAIKANRREGAFHILMLHTDVEGHQVHPIPALSMDSLRELKTAVEYVGLGHTHRHYEIDNWAFNPGSIEVTNISEYRETRGAFVVEVDENNNVTTRHFDEYHHRPFQQFAFQVTDYKEPKELTAALLEQVRKEVRPAEVGKPRPIIEIALRGHLGFPNSVLEPNKIREEVRVLTDALHVRLKNHTVPVDFLEVPAESDDPGREKLEKRVIADLVVRDSRYSARVDDIAEAVIGSKRMALSDEPADKIADFIGTKMAAR
jgi:DNA repair exonuclease SbcCD nuclease subunit